MIVRVRIPCFADPMSWLNSDDNKLGYSIITDEEIVEAISLHPNMNDEEEKVDNSVLEPLPGPSYDKAVLEAYV